MKKYLFVLILFLIIIPLNAKDTEKLKKHFIDLTGIIGFSTYYVETVEYTRSDETRYNRVNFNMGGLLGISSGYQYAFNKNFAFGGGISAFIPIMVNMMTVKNQEYFNIDYPYAANITLNLNFMFGDLKDKKTAFLFDIGGGTFFSTKIGFYSNGFVFKMGYGLSMSSVFASLRSNAFVISEIIKGSDLCHSITFDFGYKFNL